MRTKILLLFLLACCSPIFAQSRYIFKGSGLQATLPNKPLMDTTVLSGELKVRVVIAKDSASNYYLTITEAPRVDTSLNDAGKVNSFMDGVMDGMKKRHNAEVYFVKELNINSTRVREYDLKGLLGKAPLTIKSWIWIKANTTTVCQHMYLTQNEEALIPRQRLFFGSLIF